MEQPSLTWIVAADGSEARIFAEPSRAGPLRELADLRMTADLQDRRRNNGRATVHDRVGFGRHAVGEGRPAEAAERRFLEKVAAMIAKEGGQTAFEHLVLMGPPRAIGALRRALPEAVVRRLELTDPHERKGLSAEEIRDCLRAARARA